MKVRKDGAWLRIVLPSGRALCYPGAALVPEKKMRRVELDITEAMAEEDQGGRTVITYMGMNQYTRRWERITTYSGKLAENCIQAIARDVMAINMPRIEAAGYTVVLTVHDEIISEAPDEPQYNPEHLAALLAEPPPWALDMPLAAAGFEALRYRKD
jgi:DNA polymerase